MKLGMRGVAGNVLFDEMTTDRTCWENIKVARKATPFGKMVRNVESRRRGSSIFIIDKGNSVDLAVPSQSRTRLHDDVAAEEVCVAKNKLE